MLPQEEFANLRLGNAISCTFWHRVEEFGFENENE
jgi:hypothetical protein